MKVFWFQLVFSLQKFVYEYDQPPHFKKHLALQSIIMK